MSKRARIAMLTLDTMDFKSQNVTKDKKSHYNIKGTI